MGAILCITDRDAADEVDEPDEPRLVQRGAGVLLGEHTFEQGVVALDACHTIGDEMGDDGLLGLGLEVRPARFARHPSATAQPRS